MDFEFYLRNGKVNKTAPNAIRAKSMIKSSKQAIDTAKSISLNENTSKSVFRELYEGLREYCEAIGYLKGYKFQDHESITYFLKDILKEESISRKFDRYRKLRNGINYYGESIDIEVIKEALQEIPALVEKLSKYSKE